MPNRYTNKEHAVFYRFIALRDGEHCLVCKVAPAVEKPLEIDHADNDYNNWDPNNTHLLCKHCNLQMRFLTSSEHRELIALYSASNEREREREKGKPATVVAKGIVDYDNGSQEMKANSRFEIQFRDWLLLHIRQVGFMSKKEAVNAGAEEVGCSPLTAGRYLDKLTSVRGPLREAKDEVTGITVISYKITG